MKLDRMVLKGWKSIREMNLELRDLNILIGANGSGKSNLVGAFGILNQIVEGRLQATVARSGGAATLLHHGPKHTRQIVFDLGFGANGYRAYLEYAEGDRLFFEREEATFHDASKYARPFIEGLGSGTLESGLADVATRRRVAAHVLRALRSWRVHHFHDTTSTASVKQKQPLGDNDVLRADASNLAPFLLKMRQVHPGAYQMVVAAIRLVAPFFQDFVLRPDPAKPDVIQLEWTEVGSDAYFNAHSLSDGTLRFICLATLLLQPVPPALVLVDEPELGLHPFAITQLAAMLKTAATRTQVLVATQSVTLMNQFDPEDVIVVDRSDGQSTFRRIPPEEVESWMEDYALGEIWEKNVLGGRPQRP